MSAHTSSRSSRARLNETSVAAVVTISDSRTARCSEPLNKIIRSSAHINIRLATNLTVDDHLEQRTRRFEVSSAVSSSSQPIEMVYYTENYAKSNALYALSNYDNSHRGALEHCSLEAPVKELFAGILLQRSKSELVVDGGMNAGFYSILSALYGHQVIAFDMQSGCFEHSLPLLIANNIEDRVHVMFCGLSSEFRGDVAVGAESCSGGYSVRRPSHLSKENHTFVDALDHMISPDCAEFALVKLDIEGSELLALEGMTGHLQAGNVKNIIMEINPWFMKAQGSKLDDAIAWFDRLTGEYGFELFHLYSWASDKLNANVLVEVATHPLGLMDVCQTRLHRVVDNARYLKAYRRPLAYNVWFRLISQ